MFRLDAIAVGREACDVCEEQSHFLELVSELGSLAGLELVEGMSRQKLGHETLQALLALQVHLEVVVRANLSAERHVFIEVDVGATDHNEEPDMMPQLCLLGVQ